MAYRWMPIMGALKTDGEKIMFPGAEIAQGLEANQANTPTTASDNPAQVPQRPIPMGLLVCDQTFTGGAVSATVTFSKVSPKTNGEIVLYYDPLNRYNLNAGITGEKTLLFTIRHFDTKWTYHAVGGDGASLQANRSYLIEATMRGSSVSLRVDGVEVLRANPSVPTLMRQFSWS